MELDLFTPLKDGPMSAVQMADALGVSPEKLSPLLHALVAADLLTVEEGHFSNSSEADQFLVRGRDSFMGERHRGIRRRFERILQTAETIRTGVPQSRTDYSNTSPEHMESLARLREKENILEAQELMTRYDISFHSTLLDVGGAGGFLSLTITEALPQIHATIVDLPSVTPVTQRIVAEAGASGRVHVLAADIVNEPLSGTFDVAVLSNFIQVLSGDKARLALINIGKAIRPGGMIYIMGLVIDDSRTTPLETVGFNLFFLNTFDEGQAYTEREHRDWLTEAGFEAIQRDSNPDGQSIIHARKR